jgi:hypothetical protein
MHGENLGSRNMSTPAKSNTMDVPVAATPAVKSPPVVVPPVSVLPAPLASDVVTIGDSSMFSLLWKASSRLEGWTKSMLAVQVPGGAVLQATTCQKNPDGTYWNAETMVFVPNVKLAIDGNKGRKLVPV